MSDNGSSSLPDALKAAASAAAVGAAVGAARAYSARRGDEEHDADEVPEAEHEEPEHDAEPELEAEPPEEEQPEEDERDEPAALDDAAAVVRQARRLLRDLHGSDAESVSSIAPGRGGWVVGLEVVEVRRIPDSTDVLATYEVELDGGGSLVRFERVRRYHRSEADRGGRS